MKSHSYLLLVLLLGLPASAASQFMPPDLSIPSVQATGSGHAVAKPTRAVVTFTTQGTERTAEESFTEVARQTEAVLTALRRLYLRGEQLQVAALTVSPARGRDDRYTAQRIVTARVDTLSKLPAVLSAILDTGIESVRGIQYEPADPAQLRVEALDAAMDHARATAEQLAAHAGVTLGPALRIEAQQYGEVGPVSYFRTREVRVDEVLVAAAAGGYAFGTVGASAQVRVTFRLHLPESTPDSE